MNFTGWELDMFLGVGYTFVHSIAVAVYIGGAVAMEYVLKPAQRAIPPAQAQVMGQKTADRFLWLVWGALILILLTGALRLQHAGMLGWEWPFFYGPLSLFESYGRTVLAMFLIWCVLVVNGLVITFVLRPRLAGRLSARTPASGVAAAQGSKMQAATWVERLTRFDIVAALVAALLGASLRWGGML
jgi:uncharacterized membrane protein